MTVIEFKKRELKGNIAIAALLVLICASFVEGVLLYNKVAALRQDLVDNQNQLAHAQVQTAEVKNNLYSYLDEANQESFLQSRGLVLEKHPLYATNPSVAARQ
ncbi:MAG: hypothetical protein M1320_00840 [Patescibacteria group bacterium]|nr:hypothetical protein [Patescibacteria group bacterium]